MKQEILEKAAEEWTNGFGGLSNSKQSFIEGAKWQAERMYSEEEVINLIEDWTKMTKGLNMNFPSDKFEKWFEQFKKK